MFTWFSVLFIIASYIRLYGLLPQIKNAQWGGVFLLVLVLATLSVIGMLLLNKWFGIGIGITLTPYWFVSETNKILALVVGICSFMYFKDLHIKQSRIINTISASTFGVLLIHANSDTMRRWLWRDVVDCVGLYANEHLVLLSIISVLLIFISCIAIDYIRIHTLERWMFTYIDKCLSKYGLQ